jgi:ribonuclease P protein component
MKYTFNKKEKLTGERLVQEVFASKNRFLNYPLKINYITLSTDDTTNVRVLTGCPKRNFKKAVDRNRIKRLLREAYRLNCHPLKSHMEITQQKMALAIVYIGEEMPNFDLIENKIKKTITRLIQDTQISVSE